MKKILNIYIYIYLVGPAWNGRVGNFWTKELDNVHRRWGTLHCKFKKKRQNILDACNFLCVCNWSWTENSTWAFMKLWKEIFGYLLEIGSNFLAKSWAHITKAGEILRQNSFRVWTYEFSSSMIKFTVTYTRWKQAKVGEYAYFLHSSHP